MSDLVLFDDVDPKPIPAATVFAAVKLIIEAQREKEFLALLKDEDILTVPSSLVNKVKSLTFDHDMQAFSEFAARLQKCNEPTPPG